MENEQTKLLETERYSDLSLKIHPDGSLSIFYKSQEIDGQQKKEYEEEIRNAVIQQLWTEGLEAKVTIGDNEVKILYKVVPTDTDVPDAYRLAILDRSIPVNKKSEREYGKDRLQEVGYLELCFSSPHQKASILDKRMLGGISQKKYRRQHLITTGSSLVAQLMISRKESAMYGEIDVTNDASFGARAKIRDIFTNQFLPSYVRKVNAYKTEVVTRLEKRSLVQKIKDSVTWRKLTV